MIYNRDPKTGRISKGHSELTKSQRDEKFWSLVAIIPFHSCWEWTGGKSDQGYGKFHLHSNVQIKAHRYSLSLVESLKDGFVIDHICRNRACVNPKHLRQVTQSINALENNASIIAGNKKKTHCLRGHEYNLENTRIKKNGWRDCRACERTRYHNERTKNPTATKAKAPF